MSAKKYLTSEKAAEELGIRIETLYAYVSRGLIRSEGEGKKNRYYIAEDIQQLKDRKEFRKNPKKAVEGALHWGTPLMKSAITLIVDGNIYYRGKNILDIVTHYSVEEVASLIWAGDQDRNIASLKDPIPQNLWENIRAIRKLIPDLSLIERFQSVLPMAEANDPRAYDLQPRSLINTSGRILRLLTSTLSSSRVYNKSISKTLQLKWAKNHGKIEPIINSALILCADHELNASSFTARCVASTGATPYAATLGGLSALQGFKHGGSTHRIEVLFKEIDNPRNATQVIRSRLKRGERIPGFSHPLYPDGDPRGTILFQMLADILRNSSAYKLAISTIKATYDMTGEKPNIDLALVTLTNGLKLPSDSAIAIFALGRTIGWLGHAIEQYQLDSLIRPRSQYIGVRPSTF